MRGRRATGRKAQGKNRRQNVEKEMKPRRKNRKLEGKGGKDRKIQKKNYTSMDCSSFMFGILATLLSKIKSAAGALASSMDTLTTSDDERIGGTA